MVSYYTLGLSAPTGWTAGILFDGEELRALTLCMRKTNLARLLARRPDGIFVAPFEQGEIGLGCFAKPASSGLEGLVSKRRDRPY
jgi:bifunctional non-homologous end joining protein LigD